MLCVCFLSRPGGVEYNHTCHGLLICLRRVGRRCSQEDGNAKYRQTTAVVFCDCRMHRDFCSAARYNVPDRLIVEYGCRLFPRCYWCTHDDYGGGNFAVERPRDRFRRRGRDATRCHAGSAAACASACACVGCSAVLYCGSTALWARSRNVSTWLYRVVC